MRRNLWWILCVSAEPLRKEHSNICTNLPTLLNQREAPTVGIKGLKSPKENDPRPIRSRKGGGKALAVGKGANTHRTSATSYIWGAEKVHIVVARKAAAVSGKKAVGESFCVRGDSAKKLS
jgi:hypothetical protein